MKVLIPFLTINGEVNINADTLYSIEQTAIGTKIFFRHKGKIVCLDTLEPYAHCIRRLKTQYLVFTDENIQGEDLMELSAEKADIEPDGKKVEDFRSDRFI